MKKFFALVMALVVFASIAAFPVSVNAVEGEIEPRYATTICLVCGASARVVERYTGRYVGYSIVPRGGCELDRSLDSHQHDCYRDCILVNCPNCGEFEMMRSDYKYCTVKHQYIY